MSVSTLTVSDTKTVNKSDGALMINNNFKQLEINDEKSSMHDSHGSLSNEGDLETPMDSKLESKTSSDLTDDTESDSPSGDAVTNGMLEDVCESEDFVFQEDLSAKTVDTLKEKAIERLQEELDMARKALELKDEECKELTTVRSKVEAELEELTASLFEEAHKMVHEANMKQFIAEKKLNEAKGEIEALQTEASALKSLVLTSTPSNPNPQCHPQLIKKKKEVLKSPLRKNRLIRKRSRDEKASTSVKSPDAESKPVFKMGREVDAVIMNQLDMWLKSLSSAPPPAVNHDQKCHSEGDSNQETMPEIVKSAFLRRIEEEDVVSCLTFANTLLSKKVLENVHNNTLTIEPLPKPVMERCALTEVVVCCKHQIKFGDSDKWLPISLSCRTRIATVCDYLTYIRYVEKKIVRHSRDQIYWEVNKLRKEMVLAKLGYYREDQERSL